jgi:hypothetical protein
MNPTSEITLSESEFWENYAPAPNHIDPSHGFNDCLFETYGPELDYILSVDPALVWTVLECDDGNLAVVSGVHFVNRFGYFISTVRVPEGVSFTVNLDTGIDS